VARQVHQGTLLDLLGGFHNQWPRWSCYLDLIYLTEDISRLVSYGRYKAMQRWDLLCFRYILRGFG
jgi:hypothetical protein